MPTLAHTVLSCTLLSLVLPAPTPPRESEVANVLPTFNVIEFLMDDIGIELLSLYDTENKWLTGFAYPATPNIDSVAATGISFRNAWAYPVCSPDRAASLTGRQPLISPGHPYGTGLGATVDLESTRPLAPEMMALPVAHRAESSGYLHLQVGKWHLGNGQDSPMSPVLGGGVTEYRGCLTNPAQHGGAAPAGGYGGHYTNYTQTSSTTSGATQIPHQSNSMVRQEVADALELLPSDSTPFILRCWFHYGHAPWDVPVPDAELDTLATMRGNAQFPLAVGSGMTYSPSSNPDDPDYPDPNVYSLTHRRMKAMVEATDKAIGDVLAGLNSSQRLNTIVIIRSDNGTDGLGLNPWPAPMMNQSTSPLEPPATYNPLHAKASMYEQGVKVPLVIGAHPSGISPDCISPALIGTKVDALASTVDVWATMAQATLPNWKNYKTDGESLFPVLLGLTDQVRSHVFTFFFGFRFSPGESCWEFADPARCAVRDQHGYKLIRRVGAPDELYDLSTDPLELLDLYPPVSAGAMSAYAELSGELIDLIDPAPLSSFCFGDGTGTHCPCGNNNDGKRYCGLSGCANSTYPSGALLAGLGLASLAEDSLVLHVFGATPNRPGIFFQGDNAPSASQTTLLGHGLLCVSGNVLRIGSLVVNAQGYGTSPSSISGLGSVSAGETKRYQYWYRDAPLSQCSQALGASNLTNAIEVNWVP